MLNGKRKCIGVFVNRTDVDFIDCINKTIQIEAKALGYDVYFFFTVGYGNVDNEYDRQEMTMFNLAPIEKMDGILVALDTYQISGFGEALLYTLEARAKCPVVHIRQIPSGCNGVYTDESHAINEIISHVIEHHGCKRIYFLGGYEGHVDAELRRKCFYAEMAAHGLYADETYMYRGNMWRNCGEEAFDYFFNKMEKPDAIICANDLMAMSMSHAIIDHGLSVPDDVIVTGFDNIAQSIASIPSLSTIGRDYKAMARAAVSLIDRLMKEQEQGIVQTEPVLVKLPTNMILRESCGCNMLSIEEMSKLYLKQFEQITARYEQDNGSMSFYTRCCTCKTLEQLHDTLLEYGAGVVGYTDFILCMYQEYLPFAEMRDVPDTDDNMVAVFGLCDGKDIGIPIRRFPSSQLFPHEYFDTDKPQAYYISLLHQGAVCIGTFSMIFDDGKTITSMLQMVDIAVTNIMLSMYNYNELRNLSEDNHLKSITDPLTQLYNRRGFDEQINTLWPTLCNYKKPLAFICVDLDGLKTINDRFGHENGDKAIRTVADALRENADDSMVIARSGGDEYMLLMTEATEERVRKYIYDVRSKLETLSSDIDGYNVGISAGSYIFTPAANTDLNYCMRQSDIKMYHDKRKRHSSDVS